VDDRRSLFAGLIEPANQALGGLHRILYSYCLEFFVQANGVAWDDKQAGRLQALHARNGSDSLIHRRSAAVLFLF